MAVLPIKTVAKCKICSHERRADIDALLEKRANREKDATGKNINAEFVFGFMAELGIPNPTLDNIKIHWGKHCEVVSEKDKEAAERALDEWQQEMLDILDGADESIDGRLRALFNVGFARLRQKVARGQDVGISIDQMMKASAELTKRQDNESRRDLLAVLGGGIVAALNQPRAPKQIESGAEVIEQEAVEA